MKRWYISITLGAIVLATSAIAFAYQSETAEDSVRAMLMQQQDAWNQGDIQGFMKGYLNSESMQFISRKGTRKGWRQTLEAYQKHYPNKDSMGRLEFNLDEVEFLDRKKELGHVTGRWKLIRAADTPNGYFSLITRQTKEGPKIIIDHTW